MQIGRFKVLSTLGSGAYGQVFLASDADGKKTVLKVPLAASPDAIDQLRHEGAIGRRLIHPHLIETRELFEHEGSPVLVLEYVEGVTLSNIRKRLGPLPPALIVRIGRQIAEGLHAMHTARDDKGIALGLLHRDVAPTNIMLDGAGDAKLIDLGIARTKDSVRRTEVGQVRGTMRYLAPELLDGQKHAPATDLWALGIVLFESLLGRRAAEGDDRQVLSSIVRSSITELREGEQVNPRIDAALRGLLAPVATRLQSANAAAQIFKRLETQFGPPPPQTLERLRDLSRAIIREKTLAPAPTSISEMPRPITLDGMEKPLDSLEDSLDSLDSLENSAETAFERPPIKKPEPAKTDPQVRPDVSPFKSSAPDSSMADPTKQHARPSSEALQAMRMARAQGASTPLSQTPALAPFSAEDDEAPTIVNTPVDQTQNHSALSLNSNESDIETAIDLRQNPLQAAKAQLKEMRDTDATMRFPIPPKGTNPPLAPDGFPTPSSSAPIKPSSGPPKTIANDAPPRHDEPAQTMQMAIPNVPGAPPLQTSAPLNKAPTLGGAKRTMQIPIPGMPVGGANPFDQGPATMQMAIPKIPEAEAPKASTPNAPLPKVKPSLEPAKATQMMPIPGAFASSAETQTPPKPAAPKATQVMPIPGQQHPKIGNDDPNDETVPAQPKSTMMMPIPGANILGGATLPEAEMSGRHVPGASMPAPPAAAPFNPSTTQPMDPPAPAAKEIAPPMAAKPAAASAAKIESSLAKKAPSLSAPPTTNVPANVIATTPGETKGVDFDDSELAFKSNKGPLLLVGGLLILVALCVVAFLLFGGDSTPENTEPPKVEEQAP